MKHSSLAKTKFPLCSLPKSPENKPNAALNVHKKSVVKYISLASEFLQYDKLYVLTHVCMCY